MHKCTQYRQSPRRARQVLKQNLCAWGCVEKKIGCATAHACLCRQETRPDLEQHGRNLTKQVEEISFHAVFRFH